jgi:hypothetical protein
MFINTSEDLSFCVSSLATTLRLPPSAAAAARQRGRLHPAPLGATAAAAPRMPS